ncbi:helix-turn-helix transcriptional regulator [Myceligenerans indicum]|uniref:Helix-turn-helix domain-containing protein n=1 Tax=Myceligenerans indicum TaxID=2593663 RepID=A0ABS1LL48_9MICO|nr:helix-turn-helix transcriptional regulator [Myceligenerans indicum]MBL0886277.1 helix-turn-helix domain-containing protein [Myceligenerans indicum]
MTTTTPDRAALGAFLRARRARVTPADVGLPGGGRRRTPGLRREEVAQLAGVGVTWYTWLEQGRARNVSDQVLESVARVLRLEAPERRHLMVLAGRAPGATPGPPMDLRPEHVAVLEKLLPYPAAVQTDCYDLVASNRTYRFLFTDLDAYPTEDRNCAWLMFTDPQWRGSLLCEDDVLREITARLRARQPEYRQDPRWRALLNRLREASPDFDRYWETYELEGDQPRLRRYRSPRAGRLEVQFQSLWLDRGRGERIIVMTPADDATAQRLERLDALVGAAPRWTSRDDAGTPAARLTLG